MFQAIKIVLVVLVLNCRLGATRAESFPTSDVPPFGEGAEALSFIEASTLLGVVSESQRATYGSFRSWTGLVKLSSAVVIRHTYRQSDDGSKVRINGVFLQERNIAIRFARDFTGRKLFSKYEAIEPARISNLEDGSEHSVVAPIQRLNVKRPDGEYTKRLGEFAGELDGFTRSTTTKRPFTEVIIRDQVSPLKKAWIGSQFFDPCFVFHNSGHRVDSLIKKYSEQLKSSNWQELFRILQSPDERFIYVEKRYLVGQSSQVSLHRMTLDSQFGFLPVEAVVTIGKQMREKVVWSYRNGGIVPQPLRYAEIKWGADGKMSSDRSCTFSECDINPLIKEETFTLAMLEPQDGDRLLDQVEKKLQVFENGVPTEIPNSFSTQSQERSYLLIVVNVVLVIGLIGFVCLKRIGSKRGAP